MLNASATEILNSISMLLENENIRVNLTQNGRAALIAGLCTMAGGLVAGKVGVTLGGIAGTLLNRYLTPNVVPLCQVVQSGLNEEEKGILAQLLQTVLRNAPAAVAGAASAQSALSNERVKSAAIQTVMGFVQQRGLVSSRRHSSSSGKSKLKALTY